MKLVRNLMVMFFVLMGSSMLAHAAKVEMFEPGPIPIPSSKKQPTATEVRRAIISGAARHHWNMESEKPGSIRIKLDGRRDRAVLVMDVVYTTKSYSVKYVSSEGLKYDGSTIHPSYARWMKNLTDSIDMELKILDI